ncbi:S-adenosylmethionine uptake transporter [Devosia subaequoris]|uniref:S-adenosylmethionine uptake transporter n=1 Tax=Devosia subaequoris TaxID=395930 RepID=A0A7W6IJJ7_9HYPH|nr:DMT family transporter [Devosia subaequoris]MBB4050798.1 S-adenosylmethionine uptake transporter [Devosia subaequoris]MCP1208524.1 DMT family transporter [Devosia subaequoris]
MSQISSTPHNAATSGALFMLVASIAFAGTNTLQSILPTPAEYGGFGMSSTGMAFWQYLIASVLALPLILRIGLSNLKTRHPLAHEVRAFVSALGVHVFVYGFASGVPIWQMVTLLATGPLFIVLGSTLFLGERASTARIVAALAGFVGAIIVSGVGTESLGWQALIPITAAALWAATDVLTKFLTRKGESPETLTVSLLVLMTPNHLAILLVANALSGVLPTALAPGFPFALPDMTGIWLLLLLGALTAAAQYLLAFAYRAADAVYLQPFGDLKVPLSGLVGWVALGQVPSIWFWPGAALIVGASVFIYWIENREEPASLQPA